jgi:hypothetical protein
MADVGRPEFKATPALRRKVEELICCGMSKEDVARAIGCTKPTLVKHFMPELETGIARKRAEIIGMLFKSAKGGNVTAQKKLEEMSRIAGAEDALSRPAERDLKLGKKELAAEAAKTAGVDSEWGSDLTTPAIN